MKNYSDAELVEIARQIRIDIVTMLNRSKSGHTGGSLSAVEILTTLYFAVMDLSRRGRQSFHVACQRAVRDGKMKG